MPQTSPDKYDLAIAYLTENPEQIQRAWEYTSSHKAGCLFRFAGVGPTVGCLTMVKNQETVWKDAQTPELTLAIRADDRIPMFPITITVQNLPVFAEWQRRLDKELNRE